VTPAASGSASYGDRRLRDVELVDYSRPGFAVVYLAGGPVAGSDLELEIRPGRLGLRLEPAHAAVGAGGHLRIENRSPEAHVLSYPAGGAVRRIEPGQRVELPVSQTGEQGLFLLDAPDVEARIFASPGPFAAVSESGGFELRDLPPGPAEIRAWHPRFPATSARVDLEPDTLVRLDLALGVGRGDSSHAH
jgi:hypothetical protein